MTDSQTNNQNDIQADIVDDVAARRFAHMLAQLTKAFHA